MSHCDRSTCLRSLVHPPVGAAIAGAIVGVEIGAMVVHFYAHKPIELQAGLYATQPAVLPDDHHPDRAPPEPPGRLITAVSSTAASPAEANPHFVGRFTPTKFTLNRSIFQNG